MTNDFAKLALETGGSIVNLTMPSNECVGFALTNPSIFYHDCEVLLNIRNVQYSLFHSEKEQKFQNQWGVLTYLHPEDDISLTTKNAFSTKFPYEQPKYVDTSKLDVKPLWEFVGLEDARIVVWDDRTFLCGVRRDTTTNGQGRMELSEIVDGVEIARFRIDPPSDTYCEKNWMPIVDLPFHFVKWSNPTEVVKVNLETLTSETIITQNQPHISLPRDLRGGSQVITYNHHYIAVTHEVQLWNNQKGNKDGQYYHRFIVWDKDWNIVHTSNEFKFIDANIEFCCGMTQVNNEFWMTFGYQDSTAFLLKMPCENLWSWVTKKHCSLSAFFTYEYSEKYKLERFVKDCQNPTTNFDLATEYFKTEHYPSAMSFFLRSAELGTDENLIYESLLGVAFCLARLGRRRASEKTALLNAIAFCPHRFEAYFHLSCFYESEQDYFNCYAMIKIAIKNFDIENKYKFFPNVEFYKLKFQLAYSSWWVGRFSDSRKYMFELASEYNESFDPMYKQMIQNNITRLGSGDEFVRYKKDFVNDFKFPFEGIETIYQNYSQSYQDMFILTMLDGKKNGTYLEIGSADPFYGNNTFLLESAFGWEGQGLEILPQEVEKYNQSRKNKALLKNALEVDYDALLTEMSNYYQNDGCFDYLQVDCEPPAVSFEILKMIPLDKFKFAVITFEHDYYADLEKKIRQESRAYLESKGYIRVVGNVSMNDYCPYEDWWVHPDLVSEDKIQEVLNANESVVNIQNFMLGYNVK